MEEGLSRGSCKPHEVKQTETETVIEKQAYPDDHQN